MVYNVTSDLAFKNLPPKDVSYTRFFTAGPAFGDNWDGILYGKDVQHNTIVWYLRKNIRDDLA